MSLPAKVDLAHAYADRADGDHYVGVTGPGPARLAQFDEIENALPFVELGTVLAIALVVGLTFRSFGAPLLTLVASGISFLVASGIIPKVADRLGAGIPQEVEPLVVALTLGVVTDYTIFFLSACRRELAGGATRIEAARRSCTAVAPIVATAGLIVVAGSAALARRRARVLPRLRARSRAHGRCRARGLADVRPGGARALRARGLLAGAEARRGRRRGRGPTLARPLGGGRVPHLETGRRASSRSSPSAGSSPPPRGSATPSSP